MPALEIFLKEKRIETAIQASGIVVSALSLRIYMTHEASPA